jgi:hypothetical protein
MKVYDWNENRLENGSISYENGRKRYDSHFKRHNDSLNHFETADGYSKRYKNLTIANAFPGVGGNEVNEVNEETSDNRNDSDRFHHDRQRRLLHKKNSHNTESNHETLQYDYLYDAFPHCQYKYIRRDVVKNRDIIRLERRYFDTKMAKNLIRSLSYVETVHLNVLIEAHWFIYHVNPSSIHQSCLIDLNPNYHSCMMLSNDSIWNDHDGICYDHKYNHTMKPSRCIIQASNRNI